eukprot:CAMPEP_0117475054 /NCGR_PEP_ID=MMETSP0784-20121206/9598_1 /TAXON_ID=39447 /ORGANISM="" /LENGTH=56 /DNA_ID=CAMNT_0005269291 /DNA_START=34 /DNA_END=204 /DNA_ORIENTATION=-
MEKDTSLRVRPATELTLWRTRREDCRPKLVQCCWLQSVLLNDCRISEGRPREQEPA